MSGCFPTGPRYLKSTNWLQDSFIIQKCHILWTITSFHFYGDIGRKIQKQKVLEWRENGGACALVKGLAYLTPKSGDPRPPVLFPAPNHTTIDIWQNWTENRRVAKIHRAMNEISAKMKSVAECQPTLFLASDMFPSIPALPGMRRMWHWILWHKEETRIPSDDDSFCSVLIKYK